MRCYAIKLPHSFAVQVKLHFAVSLESRINSYLEVNQLQVFEPGTPNEEELQRFAVWKRRNQDLTVVRRLSKCFALTYLVTFVLIGVFSRFSHAFDIFGMAIGLSDALVYQIESIIYTLTVGFLPYLVYAKLTRMSLGELSFNPISPSVTLACTGIALAISLAGSTLASVLLQFFASWGMMPPEFPASPTGGVAMLFDIFTTVLLAPVIEEIIYRGFILGSLRRCGDAVAIIVSALLFGLEHGNMAQLPYAFIYGLVLAYFVVKTNSLYTGIFLHVVNNALAVLTDYLFRNLNDLEYIILTGMQGFFYLLLGVVGLLYLTGVRKVSWRLTPHETALSTGETLWRYLTTLPMVLVLFAMTVTIWSSFS